MGGSTGISIPKIPSPAPKDRNNLILKGTAKFNGSKSCRNITYCCSDRGEGGSVQSVQTEAPGHVGDGYQAMGMGCPLCSCGKWCSSL